MNRRLSALILSGVGAGVLLAAPNGERQEAMAADAAAVDRYLAHLSETVPRPAEARLATQEPQDPKLATSAAKFDRAERIAGVVLTVVR